MKNTLTGSNALVINQESIGRVMAEYIQHENCDPYEDLTMHKAALLYLEKLFPEQTITLENADYDGENLRVDFNLS